MLKKQKTKLVRVAPDWRFAIIASRYNAKYVDGMLAAAQREFKRAGAKPGQVRSIRVPGAFEIPAVAARLARDRKADAILCLGVILRGETSHAHHIGEAISHALAQIQVREGLPVIHEVLLFENEKQAQVRCLGKQINRGAEAARTAIEMAKVMHELKGH
ncbi:MAG: 6,7-dimethyl-8-ribityllumazine synthase [Verrucomicrobiae bacterium]|nr:6,7-dimethyl-8-ribityllumazine synthase [Verrucomicrobiae bacterium]